jgi:hypothetical protein
VGVTGAHGAQELPAIQDELHEMRQFVKQAASAANGELRDALLALERDLEVLKKKVNGGLLAALGADAPSLAGAARQADVLALTSALGDKVDRGELQVRTDPIQQRMPSVHACACVWGAAGARGCALCR